MTETLAEKDPNVPAEYWIDFHDELVQEALRREFFDVGTVLFYSRDPGFYFEVTTAGRTGAHHPKELPRAEGETLRDGSAVLTCRHPQNVSITQVSSVTWDVPTGLAKDSQRQSRTTAFVTLSGGTDGEDYDITCRMIPTAGPVIEKTIRVPVRSQ